MRSPFPGMDPYLEAHWGDVHTSLITYARDLLRPQLPGNLKVRVEERISVQDPGGDERSEVYFPDPPTDRSLQIIDTHSGNRIVTTIEILSLANKGDAARRSAYRKKRRKLAQSNVNLVEIDLLRDGSYVLIAPWDVVPRSCRGTYRVAVSRASDPDNVEMYRVPLRQRLPRIKIPMRPGDSDAVLDLQLLIDAAYENGGYDDTDYHLDPVPPLSPDDAEWAADVLRDAQRR